MTKLKFNCEIPIELKFHSQPLSVTYLSCLWCVRCCSTLVWPLGAWALPYSYWIDPISLAPFCLPCTRFRSPALTPYCKLVFIHFNSFSFEWILSDSAKVNVSFFLFCLGLLRTPTAHFDFLISNKTPSFVSILQNWFLFA